MTKKIIRRKTAQPSKPKRTTDQTLPAPKVGDTATCDCGKLSLSMEEDEAVIRGTGFVHSFRFAYCGHCHTKITFSPLLVWETDSGARYTTAERLSQGENLRIR